jgi:hypothetical protein
MLLDSSSEAAFVFRDWDFALVLGGDAAAAAIILLMLKGRVFRMFPIFSFFLCWSIFSDSFLYYVRDNYSYDSFFQVYRIQLIVDSAMIFALLVEVAWSVLRPIRDSLPKNSWIGIVVLLAVGALLLWPVAGLVAPQHLLADGKTLFRLQQTPAILRAVFFLALAAFSQLLSIGWRDRELQIASGLGFYSIVSLAVTVVHTHQRARAPSYIWLDSVVTVSYLAVLLYWVYCFARQPVERREFTPKIRSMLLAVAGGARSARIELEESVKSGK